MVHELVFSVDNPCSTTIYASGHPDKIIYHIDSLEEDKKFYTVVTREGQELAKLQWHESTPDVVHLGAGSDMPSTRMNVWMKPSLLPFNHTRSFTDVQGRKYKWKHVSAGEAMELWSADLEGEPIAVFQKALPVSDRKAMLKMGDRALEIQDLVVISFLFLEKENRIRATASNSRGNAIAAVASVGTYSSGPVNPSKENPPA